MIIVGDKEEKGTVTMIITCRNCGCTFVCKNYNPVTCPECRKNPYHIRGYYSPELSPPPEKKEKEEKEEE